VLGKKCYPRHPLTSAAKAGPENRSQIAAVNRCATQNQEQQRLCRGRLGIVGEKILWGRLLWNPGSCAAQGWGRKGSHAVAPSRAEALVFGGLGGTTEQAAEKVEFRAPGPEGAIDFGRSYGIAKRYPATKLEFFRSLGSRALPKSIMR